MIKNVSSILRGGLLAALMTTAAAAPAHAKAGAISLTNSILVQQKTAAADGTTRVTLVPAKRAVPGDHVVFRITYRNEVGQPVTGMVVSNPVPANLTYRGPAEGSPAPDVSVDGIYFAPLAKLTVAGRPAQVEQVRNVRWLLAGAVKPGASGQYSFEATIK